MPPARHATAAPRRQPRPPQRKRPRLIAPTTRLRVRWERVGRVGLLVVLAVVVGLYIEHTLSYISTRSQASQQQAIVNRLEHQNARLSRQEHSLLQPATVVSEARALGMVRPDERPYVITGKPSP
jgi:cell division protein FtsB